MLSIMSYNAENTFIFKVYCRTQLKYLRFYLFFDHSKMWKLIKVACYFFQSKFHIAGYGTMTVIYSSVF